MKKISPELLKKAKAAESVEEILALAKENDVDVTEAQVMAFFESVKSGKLSEDELDNVAGGKYYLRMMEYECLNCGRKIGREPCKYCGYGENDGC